MKRFGITGSVWPPGSPGSVSVWPREMARRLQCFRLKPNNKRGINRFGLLDAYKRNQTSFGTSEGLHVGRGETQPALPAGSLTMFFSVGRISVPARLQGRHRLTLRGFAFAPSAKLLWQQRISASFVPCACCEARLLTLAADGCLARFRRLSRGKQKDDLLGPGLPHDHISCIESARTLPLLCQ